MEYVNGPSCADLLREHRQLGVEQTVEICRGACHGLDYAHRAGVIHRDVKPGNLLVSDESGIVKLADFGIAKAAEQTRITQVGAVLGTAAYLSPEQATGEEAEAASDIYSLGVCAYQFLTGRLPHEYSSLTELALKQQRDTVVPIAHFRDDVTPELDQAIRIALERDPTHRYASALDMAAALDAGARGEETGPTQAFASTGTQLLGGIENTDATQALPATRAIRQPAAEPPYPAAERARDRDLARERPRDRNSGGRAKWVALALVLILAAVAVAILVSGTSGSGFTDINAGSPQDQAQELINYIKDHRR
jgi:serine/threonine-protein kinase